MAAISAVALTVCVAACLWAYLSTYVRANRVVPIGSDTTTYIWRSRLVQALGLSALADSSPFQFQANGSNPDRAGLLAISSSLRAALHIGNWRFMWILPALSAVVVCMAAWGFARALREPRWAGPIYGLAAAMFAGFAVTARGYFDNLLADGLLIGVAAAALFAADGKPGVSAGILLLTAALVTHWAFGVYFLAVLAGFAVVLLPVSLRAWRRGGSIWKTPAARIAAIGGGSVALGASLILWALPGAQEISAGARTGYSRKLNNNLPWYRLWIAIPTAVGGAIGLTFGRDRGPRVRGVALMLVWLASVAAAAALFAAGRPIAMQRILGFAFPLALLGAAALTWAMRACLSQRGSLRPILSGLCAVGIGVVGVASVRNASHSVDDSQPMMAAGSYSILETTGEYLRAVRPTGSIVYVVDGSPDDQAFGMVPAFRRVRAQTPGPYVPKVSTYLGDPERLLAGQPTSRPGEPGFDATANLYWKHLAPTLADLQVVLVAEPFNQNFDLIAQRHPDWQLSPGVLLARGPKPPDTLAFAEPAARPATGELARETLLALLLLTVCGAGWAVSLVRSGWTERVMLSPALGMGAITIVGIVGGRAGVSLRGRPMVGLTLLAAALGWAPAVVRWLRGGGPDADSPHREPVAQEAPVAAGSVGAGNTAGDAADDAVGDAAPGVVGA